MVSRLLEVIEKDVVSGEVEDGSDILSKFHELAVVNVMYLSAGGGTTGAGSGSFLQEMLSNESEKRHINNTFFITVFNV